MKITSSFSLIFLVFGILIASGCTKDSIKADGSKNINPTFCNLDSDCKVKDVHNCCGYYPKCVNEDYVPDIAAVKKECQEKGIASICGFSEIESCTCVEHQCRDVQQDSMKDSAR